MSSEAPQEGYLYIANMSYLAPTNNFVGVYADTREEAEEIVNKAFSSQLNFELHSLELATHDIAEAYKKGTVH